MVECNEHEHDWVYANHVLMSNPPQYPKICRKCGKEGCDRGEFVQMGNEYEEIQRKFRGEKNGKP